MQRDMELVRKIMLSVESGDLRGSVEGYNENILKYHQAQLIDAGLLEGKTKYSLSIVPTEIPYGVVIRKITWEGHDFLDAVRADTKWAKIKAFLASAGKDLTIETIKIAAKQLFSFG
jgi:hypothetical protein